MVWPIDGFMGYGLISPAGPPGEDGDDATITIGTVTDVPYGTPPTVTNVGTPGAAIFDFELEEGDQGAPGLDGDDAYCYIAYASDDDGTDFTTTFDPALNYIAILTTDTIIISPVVGDFAGLWKNYKGAKGDQGDPGAVEEAPIDGTPYARQDADWVAASAGSGHTIIDENGDPMTARTNLEFTGAGVEVTDVGGTNTVVTIPGGGSSDLVQVATGAGSIVIPGLAGSPDIVPASPSAYDDEFDAASTFTTILGTSLDQNNVTDVKSHLHLLKTATGTMQLWGVYKTCPSLPFTVTAKANIILSAAAYQGGGLMLLDGTPTKITAYGFLDHSTYNDVAYTVWANRASRSSSSDFNMGWAVWPYLRLYVASSTSVTFSASPDGRFFRPLYSAQNPGFTVTYIGLYVSGMDNSVPGEAYFDWIRFT